MAALRESCLAALAAQIGAAVTPVPVARDASAPPDLASFSPSQWVGLTAGEQIVLTDYGMAGIRYQLAVILTVLVAAPTDAALGPALHALYAAVVAAALAGDRRLGGVAEDITEGPVETDIETGDAGPCGGLAVTLFVDIFTAQGNPAVAA